MTTEHEKHGHSSVAAAQGHSTLFARFLWAMVGPILLLVALMSTAQTTGWLGFWEGAYVLTVALMIWGRYLEQKSGHGTTLYSEPSTWDHFRAYTMKLIAVAVLLWGAAKLSGRYLVS